MGDTFVLQILQLIVGVNFRLNGLIFGCFGAHDVVVVVARDIIVIVIISDAVADAVVANVVRTATHLFITADIITASFVVVISVV